MIIMRAILEIGLADGDLACGIVAGFAHKLQAVLTSCCSIIIVTYCASTYVNYTTRLLN